MYSKEEKERILADFFESGMTEKAFSDLPCRPSRMSMRRWRAAAERGELEVPERRVAGRVDHERYARYPAATKAEAVRLSRAGMPNGDVARRLGISSPSVVAGWVRRAGGRGNMYPAEGGGMADGAPRTRLERECAEKDAIIAELEARLDVARAMISDPKAGDPASLSNRRKAECGERLRRERGWSLAKVLTSLKISKSSYFYALRASERDEGRAAAVDLRVARAFASSRGAYGYRRVRACAAAGADGGEPMALSEREVRESMARQGLVARRGRGERAYSSYAGEPDGRPANLPLGRRGRHEFKAPAPGMLLVTDVTEFKVGGEKVYLSPVIDCFDGLPVSWSTSRRPDAALCDSSLRRALASLPPHAGSTVVHTDGGSCYRSRSWKAICEESGVIRSMSRKGNCGDNARAEGLFGTLKSEFFNGVDWAKVRADDFMAMLDDYLAWYCDGRLKAFRENGRTVYDTIAGRRRRLGLTA